MIKLITKLCYFILCFVLTLGVCYRVNEYNEKNSFKTKPQQFEICVHKKDFGTGIDCWIETENIVDLFKTIKHNKKINEYVLNNVRFSIKSVTNL